MSEGTKLYWPGGQGSLRKGTWGEFCSIFVPNMHRACHMEGNPDGFPYFHGFVQPLFDSSVSLAYKWLTALGEFT